MNNWRAECLETGTLRSGRGRRKRSAPRNLAGGLLYQVTKIKAIKRQIYGRAGIDLLRKRVLLAG